MKKPGEPLHILMLIGGKSTEHEGSILSAYNLISTVDLKKYHFHCVYISREGSFTAPEEYIPLIPDFFNHPDIEIFKDYAAPPPGLIEKLQETALFSPYEDTSKITFFDHLQNGDYDLIFPVLHGTNGEDGHIQGFLNYFNIPVIGSGLTGAFYSSDKAASKMLCQEYGIPIAQFILIQKFEWELSAGKCLERISHFPSYPLFIKPVSLGSSIGITKVHQYEELIPAIKKAFQYDSRIIVEEMIEAEEVAVGIISGNEMIESDVALFQSNQEFFDYEAKYGEGNLDSVIPAPYSASLTAKIKDFAAYCYRIHQMRGMARVDIFLDSKEKLIVNEINSIPGQETHSTFNKQFRSAGITPQRLFELMVQQAFENDSQDSQYRTDFL